MPSFDDAPQFSSAAIDKATQRFIIPKTPGDPWYFKSGVLEVALVEGPPEANARKIAEAVAAQVLKGKGSYKFDVAQNTRFGYYLHVIWGTPEENNRGHDLNVMVNLKKKVIWWNKCD